MTIGIYSFTAPNGDCYIGQSRNIEVRYESHINQLRKGTHKNRLLQIGFNENVLTFKMEIACPINELNKHEQHLIDTSQSLYNINRKVGSVKCCVNRAHSAYIQSKIKELALKHSSEHKLFELIRDSGALLFSMRGMYRVASHQSNDVAGLASK